MPLSTPPRMIYARPDDIISDLIAPTLTGVTSSSLINATDRQFATVFAADAIGALRLRWNWGVPRTLGWVMVGNASFSAGLDVRAQMSDDDTFAAIDSDLPLTVEARRRDGFSYIPWANLSDEYPRQFFSLLVPSDLAATRFGEIVIVSTLRELPYNGLLAPLTRIPQRSLVLDESPLTFTRVVRDFGVSRDVYRSPWIGSAAAIEEILELHDATHRGALPFPIVLEPEKNRAQWVRFAAPPDVVKEEGKFKMTFSLVDEAYGIPVEIAS